MSATATEAPRAPLSSPALAAAAPFLVPFVLALALNAMRGVPGPDWLIAGLGNDSAMRLVAVRDLLAGQGWFDPMQHRLGEGGTFMHWSRLVDAPIAALILAFEPALGRAGAEHAALVLWPVAMLSTCTAAAFGIGRAAGGRMAGLYAGGCTFAALVVGSRFSPGDIDHHNLQLALLLAAVWGTVRGGRAPAALGGLAIASSLAVGVETLPMLAALGLSVALAWAAHGAPWRETAIWMPLGLAGGLSLLFPLTAPAAAWAGGYCDAISVDLALPVAAGALLLSALAARATDLSALRRAGLLAAGGGAVAVATAAFAPACLSNPYDALDPWLVARWLDLVEEAKGLGDVLAGEVAPAVSASFAVGAVAALLAACAAIASRGAALALPAMMLVLAWAMSAYQIRSSLYVIALSACILGVLAARLRARGGAASALALLCLAAPLPMVWEPLIALASAPRAAPAPRPSCAHPGAWDALAARPAGMVSASTDLGAAILRDTHHSVPAAPYHRNPGGMIAQLRITLAPDAATARGLLAEMGATHVALCPGVAELRALERAGHTGFFHDLAGGTVPDWLDPLPAEAGSGLRIYALR